MSEAWWDGVLARENQKKLASLFAEMQHAMAMIDYLRATNVHGATADDLAGIDSRLRQANQRYWQAHTAYQKCLKATKM